MARERILTHGAEGFVYAVWNPTTSSFYTPQVHEGLTSVEIENESDVELFYADNIAYATLSGNSTRKITLGLCNIENNLRTYGCGYKSADNGLMIDTGSKSYLAVQFIEKCKDVDSGEEFRRLHIFYRCKINGQPKEETETNEDKLSPVEWEVELSSMGHPNITNSKGKLIDYVVVDETADNKSIFENYTKQIYRPLFA